MGNEKENRKNSYVKKDSTAPNEVVELVLLCSEYASK
jgi:hypothetical protein